MGVRLSFLSECLLATALTLVSMSALAKDFTLGDIVVSTPWTRATPNGAPVAGGYLTVTNKGTEPDRLVGGSADFAGKVEIHEMAMANGVMTMRQLPNGLEIKPGAPVQLSPGSFHVMFLDLKHQLKQGETVKGTLTFQKAGSLPVEFSVESMGAQVAPMQMGAPKAMDMPMH